MYRSCSHKHSILIVVFRSGLNVYDYMNDTFTFYPDRCVPIQRIESTISFLLQAKKRNKISIPNVQIQVLNDLYP